MGIPQEQERKVYLRPKCSGGKQCCIDTKETETLSERTVHQGTDLRAGTEGKRTTKITGQGKTRI